MDPEVSGMTALLTKVSDFFTSILTMVASLITTITGSDYLMIGFSIVVISFVVGLLVRIVSKLGHAAR